MDTNSLTVGEMKLLVAIGDALAENGGQMPLKDLELHLKGKGFSVGNGLSRERDKIEAKICGEDSTSPPPLFLKTRNATQLGPAGLEVVRQLRALLVSFSQLQSSVLNKRHLLRVGLTNSLAINMFPRVLKESKFIDKYPDVDIEVIEGEPHEMVNLLQSGLDFAVCPKTVNNGFESWPLCEWRRVLLYSRNQQYRHKYHPGLSIHTLQEYLRNETLLLPAARIIPELDSFLKPMSSGRRITVPQASLRRIWVEHGIGLAISYEEKRGSSEGMRHDDPIGMIDLSSVLGTTQMHLYCRSEISAAPHSRDLMDAIRTIYRSEVSGGLGL